MLILRNLIFQINTLYNKKVAVVGSNGFEVVLDSINIKIEKKMLKKIDHLGIAVHSIEKARSFYEDVLGLACDRVEEVASQKVRVAFFKIGEVAIELLEPTDPGSPIAGFLKKHGEGIHHVGYLSEDIRRQLERASQKGYRLIHEKPVPGAGGKEIAFLHPAGTNGVLTEICSKIDNP